MLRLLFIIGLLFFAFSPVYSNNSTLLDTTLQLPQVGKDLGGFMANISPSIANMILAIGFMVAVISVLLMVTFPNVIRSLGEKLSGNK